jgi:amino acid adenylation domain-containing protein/non-ribosomal peptide synthase protein (TIGR01720 family)
MSDNLKRIAELSPEKRALLMLRMKKKQESGRKPGIAPRANRAEYPLSFAQERMWFLDQLVPDSPMYNISAAIRLSGQLDQAALETSLNEIVRRQEILRVYFKIEDGNPVQRLVTDKNLTLAVSDLSDLDPAEREQKVRNLATKEARKSFNLSRWPLLRVTLLRLAPKEHVLLLTIHHIIADGWSIGVMIREVAANYTALTSGKVFKMTEMPIQYADFAAWQRHWLQGEVLKEQLDYWKSQLDGQQAILELPADRPRPAIQSFHGQRIPFALTAPVSRGLREISRQEGTTLFMTTLAAFTAFLFRYTGQPDISVGSPIANRNQAEIEGLIGFFVNTWVLRSRVTGKMTFRELLQQVREVALGAYAHQDLPFEKLVEELQIPRDMSHSPLYQVVFDLQNSLLENFEIPGLKLSVIETENETAKFDLMLQLEEGAEQIKGVVEYNTDLFEATTIRRMLQHFENLLLNITNDINQPISELELMSAPEKRTVLVQWNQTGTEYPREKSIIQIFEERVAQTPDAIAAVFGADSLTYFQLNQRANQLAYYLQKLGVGRNSRVTMVMERSLEMIIATLGILKAGGVYVPLDTAYPKDRLAFMLQDTQAPVLLTQQNLLENLPENHSHVVCVDSEEATIAQESAANPPVLANGNSVAYIIYTSGSTGIPKGVAVPHKAISRLVLHTNYVDFLPTDRVGQASNVSFDAATWEIWGAFLNGAALVGISKDVVLNPQRLVDFIREQRISMLFLTTSLFNQVAGEIPDAFKTLRTIMFGGEAADPKAVRTVLENGAPKHALNGYGPTENTTFSAVYEATHVPANATSLSIGKPIANSTAYILDTNFNPIPVGVVGELYVGGDGVALEYFNRPELTAEKFVPDPFSREAGAKMYRTGDLARYAPDGNIEFLGRIDHQVKIRGFRIELGEIESVLQQHPALQDGLVIAREDKPGQKRLVAYFIPKNATVPETSELRAFLHHKLPDYMIPTAFVALEVFPLTSNGKVDRRALPAPEQNHEDFVRNYVPPRTKLEETLVEMWQEILGIEKIGIYDNFFELGGNSLQAAVFINRIQKKFKEEAHVRSIFLAPTIAEFATYVNEYYAHIVAKFFGADSSDTSRIQTIRLDGEAGAKITPEKIQRFNQIIQPLKPRKTNSQPKNPPAIFVLSPPRSGSTLFRVMLAGNPKLFAPPELDLLSFNTLAERRTAFSNEYQIWQEAAWRSIMEVKNCSVEEAREIMEDCEARNLPAKDFYRQLQAWIQEKILVDKTPSYPMDLEILKRAEQDFENPKYIHLTRHPYGAIYSFLEAKLDKNFFRYEHPFSRRELAELIWIVCHQNILDFLKQIPAERQIRVDFETLVGNPNPSLRTICEFLEIDFHPDMLKPYGGERMTDGVTPSSQMVGDFKFYLHKKIDSQTADRWRKFHHENFLSASSWQLAQELGYFPTPDLLDSETATSFRTALTQLKPVDRAQKLPLSFQQQRLWFLDQLEPGSSVYNVPVALRIKGALNLGAAGQSLNAIIQRHEILRTNFANVDGQATLVFRNELKINLKLADLSALPAADQEARAVEIIAQAAQQPFNLTTDPLIRALVVQLEETNFIILLTLHHIVVDGWSAGIITREFAHYYHTFAEALESSLPVLPLQYADFANWQGGWLTGDVLEKQLNYWREHLKEAPAALELPTDRPRPAEMTYSGNSERFNFSASLTQSIKNFGRRNGLTEFMTLLAGFQVLLFRYSDQDDICIGTPIANRGRAELEDLIGFFVNTLVIRTQLTENPNFLEVAQRVKSAALGAFAHQDLPFEMLVDDLKIERIMSRTPLFQVMFAFQNTPGQHLTLPGLEILPYYTGNVTSKFDLTVTIREFQGEFRGTLEYNTDLFEAATIRRMLSHFQIILENAVSQPTVPVFSYNVLPTAEQHQLLVGWNETGSRGLPHSCLHQLFEQQVLRTPATPAVVFGATQLTYAELNQRANQLARYLQKRGVSRESLVGLFVERSVEMIVGILGIFKAGGAYVALDPNYPKDRLEYIVADSRISVVLTLARQENLPVLPDTQIVRLDVDWPAIASEADQNPDCQVAAENLAYLIYTSGSTGRPKGVMVTHATAINLWAGLNQMIYRELPQRSLRISLNAPLLFDASVQQIVMLLSGHTLDILPQSARQDGEALTAYLREHKIELLDCVPSQLKLLIHAGLFDGPAPMALLPGGEAIDEATWHFLKNLSQTETFNMYGPTECTVDSTIGWVRAAGRVPTIGRPINNVRLYVLDKHGLPAPIGVPGELFIGGNGLARGYLNRPDLTAERFVPDSFASTPGERLYRTGDRVRYLSDGNLEFLGRIDFQVKVRGFRIELGEIEATLTQHAAIKEAVVTVREDIPGAKRLVGYFVPQNGTEVNHAELKTFLAQKLPEYMIPALFARLNALPLTPNGKLDRKALPTPEQDRDDLGIDFMAPQTAIEKQLAQVWQEVLGIEQVGIHDNFFELGGDSILTIQVVARAKKFGLQLTPKQLFQHPTITGLATVAGTTPPIFAEQGRVTGEVPLTPIQQRFFELNFAEPNHWNQSILLEVLQPLEIEHLQTAVARLLSHHDALRLRFEPTTAGWTQTNGEFSANVPVELFDFAELSETELPFTIENTANNLQAGLNTSGGILLRVAYFYLGEKRNSRLFLTLHHLAVDGVSWRIFMEDLFTAYQQLANGNEVLLPAKTTAFKHWSEKLTAFAQSETLQNEREYWLRLKNIPVHSLPTDFTSGENTEKFAKTEPIALDAAQTAALLQEVPAVYGTEMNDVLLTALLISFNRWTGESGLLFDLEGHGREDLFGDVDLSRTVGWFTTVYPVFLQHPNVPNIGELLKSVKEQLRRIPGKGIGFGLLRYLNADSKAEFGQIPRAEIAFNYLGQFDQVLPASAPFLIAKESRGRERSLQNSLEHLISINCSILEGRLQVAWIYSEKIFGKATIQNLARNFIRTLGEIIEHCQHPESGGYTPSDFNQVELAQDDIAEILAELDE